MFASIGCLFHFPGIRRNVVFFNGLKWSLILNTDLIIIIVLLRITAGEFLPLGQLNLSPRASSESPGARFIRVSWSALHQSLVAHFIRVSKPDQSLTEHHRGTRFIRVSWRTLLQSVSWVRFIRVSVERFIRFSVERALSESPWWSALHQSVRGARLIGVSAER